METERNIAGETTADKSETNAIQNLRRQVDKLEKFKNRIIYVLGIVLCLAGFFQLNTYDGIRDRITNIFEKSTLPAAEKEARELVIEIGSLVARANQQVAETEILLTEVDARKNSLEKFEDEWIATIVRLEDITSGLHTLASNLSVERSQGEPDRDAGQRESIRDHLDQLKIQISELQQQVNRNGQM